MSRLTQGERIVLIGGVLLIIDLLFLPWHSVHLNPVAARYAEQVGFDPTPAAVQSPSGAYGIAAVIFTLVMVAQIVIERFTKLDLPAPGVPWAQVQVVAGVFVAVILVIKLVRDTGGLGYGAYTGVLGGLLVAAGGYTINQESVLLA
ncbi:MAG TPA: hypothetical protein VHZ75_03950 [Solirubrobacteraceae bacterium]|jgi:hypothetical protein|nr:hypothetical protein [Solirubrobacteraceae bacterium]